MRYIDDLGEAGRDDVARAGGKGAGLGELVRAGLPVPPGFVLTTAAYELYIRENVLADRIQEHASLPAFTGASDYDEASGHIRGLFTGSVMPAAVVGEIRDAYRELDTDGAGQTAAAVRSSATAEDLATASFAGQQDTYLNVRGADALIEAVINCWASLWTSRAMAYRAREGIRPDQVRLAVVVQKMVAADAAGVMFTANPATGRRDQAVISAAWGLGEAVVSGAVSTDDIVVDAATGKVVSRRTADKDVMTVYAEQGTREEPVPASRRHQPVLDDDAAASLAGYGRRIAQHFGTPQDIEWARADGEFFILQSRPVTALPEPAGEVPSDWAVPYPKGLYFRASIVEQLPDPLSPLFADLIDGSVSRSLQALLGEAFGKSGFRDGDLGLPAINGYAYYYYRTSGLLRLIGKMPAAARALFRGEAHMGIEGWRDYSHPRYVHAVQSWSAKPVADLSGQELLAGVTALLDAGTVYYTAVQSVIPIAATGELAFQKFYNTFIRRDGDPPAAAFLLGYESEPIRADKALYDVAEWSRGVPGLAAAILATRTTSLARAQGSGVPPAGMDPGLWHQWEHRFQLHLDCFGHAVYNLDFINPVPADDPSPLLDALKFYLRGQGTDPHRRQQLAAARREKLTRNVLARLHPARKAAFTRMLRWAQAPAPVREDALADVGLGWPLMRRMLRELGGRLVAAGVITEPDDVFWLRHGEISSAVGFGLADPAGPAAITGPERPVLAESVDERRLRWRGQRKAAAPQMLPEIRWLQRSLAGMMPEGSQDQPGNTIKGVGARQGRVRAPARVLAGPEDFPRMRPGEVLVARITTPAWTPLFAMASAVVTDVGGPLSHSSIVAREYGIPAVLGTGVATRRIASGQQIEVDGEAGTVTIVPPTPS
ncbi:PEP/pyruvate-binding domain-containing protein [Arthrobacter sp. ISL-72]|uniref:PEP/pyruvate-binding domain-containing protein n=1 Tax=Arthrobacter sp. ISL-72 TaxID=2819114 RepID=UPI001BE5A87D|nr:PEP/pyruvate-binding domain-containing protein [Arthrobacter sp. ISL-72]MBT2594360.1 phosphoenolpyruvate synthase [Arthrobacter sp. ISL-72]